MGDTGREIGKAVGSLVGENGKIPFNQESAERAGEVAGEMAEAGVKMLAERLSE